MSAMRFAVAIAVLAVSVPLTALTQNTAVLRVTVVLTDADGNVTPIPRVVLLVSDNPATSEPRRVRTGPDGAVEVRLPPGNYTVESDAPITLGAQAYIWTQTIDLRSGSNLLSLTSANAEVAIATGAGSGGAAPMPADSAVIFNKWRHSIVEIWTPTAHASGFVVDARGFIATSARAIGEATVVEVELAGADRFKIAGRVIAVDRQQGAAIIWIDPAAVSAIAAIPTDCTGATAAPIKYEQKVVTLVAPMLEPKSAILGTVGRVETASFRVDWHLTGASAGGPVFDAGGRAIGITLPEAEQEDGLRLDAVAIPLSHACGAQAAAEKTIAGATLPPGAHLRVEGPRAATRIRNPADPKAPRMSIPTISSANFDVSLMTPAMTDNDVVRSNPRADFANWTEYVNIAPPVLMVRVSPKFEESVWKTILRGAAATQGAALPPLKSFTANFLRMRAFCGTTEVAPIHPFTIVREVRERASIREGLYVFAAGDFGPHCGTVRFDLYSEKSPDRADTLTVDPKLLAQITGGA